MENNKIIEYIEKISKNYEDNYFNRIIKNKAIKYYTKNNINYDDAIIEINKYLNLSEELKNNDKKTAKEELIEIDEKLENLYKEMKKFYKKNTQ